MTCGLRKLPLSYAVLAEGRRCGSTSAVYDNMQDLSWLPAYRAKVPALLAKQGGRYIARAVGGPWEVLEGTRPPITGVTIIEFLRWKRHAPHPACSPWRLRIACR